MSRIPLHPNDLAVDDDVAVVLRPLRMDCGEVNDETITAVLSTNAPSPLLSSFSCRFLYSHFSVCVCVIIAVVRAVKVVRVPRVAVLNKPTNSNHYSRRWLRVWRPPMREVHPKYRRSTVYIRKAA